MPHRLENKGKYIRNIWEPKEARYQAALARKKLIGEQYRAGKIRLSSVPVTDPKLSMTYGVDPKLSMTYGVDPDWNNMVVADIKVLDERGTLDNSGSTITQKWGIYYTGTWDILYVLQYA